MSQCNALTKTGGECSRIVKDGGNLCFQHKQVPPSPKATPQGPYGKKAHKIKKPECLNDSDKYVWVVGKGCFEKLKTSAQPSPVVQPQPPPSPFEKTCVSLYSKAFSDERQEIQNLNCYELPLRDVKYILGPCSFFYFKIGERNFYLFGERHDNIDRDWALLSRKVNKFNTLRFSSFVHCLAKQNPTKTYDLMFESWTLPKKIGLTNSNAVSDLRAFFEPCIRPEERFDCEYRNLRTHYVDYRRTDVGKILRTNLDSQAVETLLTTGKTAKQIAAIKDPFIRTQLELYFRDLILKRKDDATSSAFIIMDIYAIARIFRDFDSSIEKKENDLTFKGTSQNVIYYAGRHHIKTLVVFLYEYLKIKDTYKAGTDFSANCPSFLQIDTKKAEFIN